MAVRAAVAVALLASSSRVLAATILVDTFADELNTDGDCALREAIQAANTDSLVDGCGAGSGADVIQVPILAVDFGELIDVA